MGKKCWLSIMICDGLIGLFAYDDIKIENCFYITMPLVKG